MKTMDETSNNIFLMHEPEHEPVNFTFGASNRQKTQSNYEMPISQQTPQQYQVNHNLESNTIPLSESSTSTSTSSGFSSVAFSKQENFAPTSNSDTIDTQIMSKKHNSSPTPQTSRRTSGNSITIRITSESDNNFDEESKDYMGDEKEDYEYEDRDEAEDTTSNSTSNENVLNNQNSKHKKPKERKQFVRSSIQQQHHLTNQESEDLIEEEKNKSPNHLYQEEDIREYPIEPSHNMNSAFDELFAAAETGNNSISAIIEAKMAASAAAHSSGNIINEFDTEIPFGKKNSIGRSRNGSFRSKQSTGSVKKTSSRTPPNDRDDSRLGLNDGSLNGTSLTKKAFNSSLKTDGYLGSPQQLTRSCSCKRPASFKRMKSKNASPSRNGNEGTENNQSRTPTLTAPSVVNERRGTQCSISILENLENQLHQNRAGSLPFEHFNNLIQNHQLQVHGDENTEVYRVRQFNTTNKGSIINRGDSFKRSFKRSSQSISSNKNNKKDNSPTYLDTKNLNLPDYQDGYLNKSSTSSKYGINETSFINESANLNGALHSSVKNMPNNGGTMQVMTYIVYVMGASTVGKNALIKQFKTSEYRGTYDISAHLSNDEDDEGVSVMLDGLESRLQFISIDTDASKIGTRSFFEITKDNNAFIVVYSISDKSSFIIAVDILKNIRMGENRNQPIILVGNKSDLVRKRSISREDGRSIAIKYGCKFVETSVAINDKVDDLLAGVLKQIRINIEAANNHNQEETNDNPKKLKRNNSDAFINEIIKKASGNNTISFKSNTLTRRLFKSSKNKDNGENGHFSLNNANNKNQLNNVNKDNNLQATSRTHSSFSFVKFFNTLFKKKVNHSQVQSVENLFTPPVTLAKYKKLEK